MRAAAATAWLGATLVAGGCGAGTGSEALVVSAASSLTGAFERLAADFEADNPDVEVLLNFDSSATLANQIDQGAPAHVFASADAANMAQVVDSGRAEGEPVAFATNDLVIVTRPGNELGVRLPADLEAVVAAGEVVALCSQSAPCGRLADELLTGDGRDPVELPESGVTRAPNARATLGAVSRGDAAAGVVYRTDALVAGDEVELLELGVEDRVSTDYLVVPLAQDPDAGGLAAEFVDLVVSAEGRGTLAGEGFR